MACVVCGKRQRILSVDSIKYVSENSVPEVLSIAIGNKVTDENWNDGEKKICLGCNRKCKEFDELSVRLEDLKQHLLKEYAKKVYREMKGENAEREKKFRAKDCDEDSTRETSTDKEHQTGTENVEKEVAEKDAEKPDNESECQKETEANETGETDSVNVKVTKVPQTAVTMTIKNESEESSEEEADAEWAVFEKLPGSISRVDDFEKIRLFDRDKLHRLPDFEYQQWYVLDAYSYVLQTENGRGQLLKCSNKSCPVSCRVMRQSGLVKVSGEHHHEPQTKMADRNSLYEKLKERCMKDKTTPLLQIYEEEAQRHPIGASILDFPEVRMREWRASSDPTIIIHTNSSTLEDGGKKYHCDVCNMGFNSSRLLQRHADKHNVSKTKRKQLSGAEQFVAHSDQTEDKRKLRKVLDKKLKRVIGKLKTDEGNAENDGDDAKECHICNEKFSRLAQVKKHILENHKEVLMCEHCDVAFDTLLLLKRHKISCRKCCDERLEQKQKNKDDRQLEKELSKITGQEAGENPDQDPDDPDWEVSKAGESTADEGENSVPAKKKKTEEILTLHSCQVCDMLFPDRQTLHSHMYAHSSVNKYECGTCGKSFNKKAVLTRHMIAENHKDTMKLNEPKIDPVHRDTDASGAGRVEFRGAKFECVVCFASFPRQAALLHHMRRQKHITDQIIIHEPQMKPTPVKRTASRSSRYFRDAIKENLPAESNTEGVHSHGKRGAEQPWQTVNGKKPLECAVCGDGFQSKIKLLAHMEATGHLTDSIVENVPVLEEMSEADQNQIFNTDYPEVPIEIKQEPKVEILSQVILPPGVQKQELPDENDQAYFIQTGENGDGETVMVIQGDIDGSLTENMQLYMDEEGNIVTHDEDGNPVRVMQVDLSAFQNSAEGAVGDTDETMQGIEEHQNAEYYAMGQTAHMKQDNSEYITPDTHIIAHYQDKTEDSLENENFNQSNDSSENQQSNINETHQEMPSDACRQNMPLINIEIDVNIERDEDTSEIMATDNNKHEINEIKTEANYESLNVEKEKIIDVNENLNEEKESLNEVNDRLNEEKENLNELNETLNEEKETLNEVNENEDEEKEAANENSKEENVGEIDTNERPIDTEEQLQEADEKMLPNADENQHRALIKTPRKSEIEKSKVMPTPRKTRHSLKVESQNVEKEKISTRSRSTRK